MSLKVLHFEQIICPEDILFDKISICVKFKTVKLQVCEVKQADFQHIRSQHILSHKIAAKIKVPPNFQQCTIYLHPTIINMRTSVEMMQFKISKDQLNDNCFQIYTQTEIGPFHMEIKKQHEFFIANKAESEVDSSIISTSDVKQYNMKKQQNFDSISKNSALKNSNGSNIVQTKENKPFGVSTKCSSNLF